MSKILKAVKVFALVIVGNMIAQAIFIGSIAAYVNFLMPEYTIGTDVAALITEEYGLQLKQLVSAKIISPEEAEILQLDEPVARQVKTSNLASHPTSLWCLPLSRQYLPTNTARKRRDYATVY